MESLLKGAGVTLLRGRAVITAPENVRVTGESGGDYEARRILIATGSVPVRPPIPGLELAMTSDELLEGTDHLYRSIVIIGGGVIGVEFATFYSDLGCSVTLLEGMDRLLPNMDRELGQNRALPSTTPPRRPPAAPWGRRCCAPSAAGPSGMDCLPRD